MMLAKVSKLNAIILVIVDFYFCGYFICKDRIYIQEINADFYS
jgi:hypothetical protein